MSATGRRRFSNCEALRRFHPANLAEFLRKFQPYLDQRGVALPVQPDADTMPYEKLVPLFMQVGEDTPKLLQEAMCFISEMSTEPNRRRIEVEARLRHLTIRTHDGCTNLDYALLAWLQYPDLLEQVHARAVLKQRRAFHYYPIFPDEIPSPQMPTAEGLRAVEEDFDVIFSANDQGRRTKILIYPEKERGEIWFLVRHGGVPTRAAGFDLEHKELSFLYRPEEYDVLIYDARHGLLRINAKKYHEGYRFKFGNLLFGDQLIFRDRPVFTLDPLHAGNQRLLRGEGVEGIAKIQLVELKYSCFGACSKIVTENAEDLLADTSRATLLPANVSSVHYAQFHVAFTSHHAARPVKLTNNNEATYSSDADSTALEAWMRACGFFRQRKEQKREVAA